METEGYRREIKAFLKRGAAKRLHLEQLPGYAPDLNPDEGIWNYLKRVELGNVCCTDLEHLLTQIIRAGERLRHKREIIRSCVQECGYLTEVSDAKKAELLSQIYGLRAESIHFSQQKEKPQMGAQSVRLSLKKKGGQGMLLTAPDDSTFEMKLLAYEYLGARKDLWDLNLLRVLLAVRYADGTEARATTYLLTSEVKRLITWFDTLLHKQVTESECHFYHGELHFELFELLEEYVAFRASFSFSSHGRESLLPQKREKEYEWLGHLEFDLTYAQLETALSSFKDETALFPERVSQIRKGNT